MFCWEGLIPPPSMVACNAFGALERSPKAKLQVWFNLFNPIVPSYGTPAGVLTDRGASCYLVADPTVGNLQIQIIAWLHNTNAICKHLQLCGQNFAMTTRSRSQNTSVTPGRNTTCLYVSHQYYAQCQCESALGLHRCSTFLDQI